VVGDYLGGFGVVYPGQPVPELWVHRDDAERAQGVLPSAAPLAEAEARGYNKLTLGQELRLDAAKKQAFKEAADLAGLAPCRPGSGSG
jgi:hypothetical protein